MTKNFKQNITKAEEMVENEWINTDAGQRKREMTFLSTTYKQNMPLTQKDLVLMLN